MSIKNYLILTKKYKAALSTIHTVYRLINSTYDLKNLILRLARLTCQTLSARNCAIVILDPANKKVILKCAIRHNAKCVVSKNSKVFNSLERRVIRKSQACRSGFKLAVPLIADDLIGMIILDNRKDNKPFDSYDQEILMTLGEQAVIGIRNLQLYEEQQKIILGSIKSLVTLFDTRVPCAYTHSPYFSRLVCAIGREMHLDEKGIQSLKFASLLHDAGKVDIPIEILTKSSQLTEKELSIIRGHPVRGVKILRHLEAIRPAIPIILHHHEKFNGTGYPSRLKKGQIPLGARIMAVADAFEAIVYGRPYRERVGISDALKEIKHKSGTQFDPNVVDAFLRAIKKFDLRKYLRSG
ncbi:MAG: HD domain-containing phosphohydrolase [Candidatus Omnitrophota bacterium]